MSDVGWILVVAAVFVAATAPGLAGLLARDRDNTREIEELQALRLADAADRMRLQDELIELRRGLAILVAQLRRSKLEPEWSPSTPVAVPAGSQQEETRVLVRFYQRIAEQFDLGEQAELWMEMGWHDGMRGETTADRARELVAYAKRRHCLDELAALCRRLRPEGGF